MTVHEFDVPIVVVDLADDNPLAVAQCLDEPGGIVIPVSSTLSRCFTEKHQKGFVPNTSGLFIGEAGWIPMRCGAQILGREFSIMRVCMSASEQDCIRIA